MFTIFLVEDEVNIRQSIRDTLDWEAAGFEYQGDAPDGELALKAIRKLRPDIVITDIKMPFVDGLELAELVRSELPDTRIIILSGHGDFAYAQKAIRLGVVEYLLKPISPMELMKAVNRVAAELQESLASGAGATPSQKVAQRKKRNDFLQQLLSGGVVPSEVFARVTELGLPFRDHYFLVASLKHNRKGRDIDMEVRMAEELDQIAQFRHAVVHEQGKGEFAVIFQGESGKELDRRAHDGVAGFVEYCRNSLEIDVFAGIGGATERLHELNRSLRESEAGCNYAIFTGAREPVFFSHIRGGDADPGLVLAERLEKAGEFFQKGEPSEVAEYARDIRLVAAEVGVGGMGLHYAYIDILMTAGRFLKSMHVEPETVLPEFTSFGQSAFAISSPEQLEGGVAEIYGRVVAYRKKHLAGRYNDLLGRAKEYIDGNYGDPELSLNMVAMHVHVSPTHFSTVFSREVGETFSDYLSRVRMDNAMRLLKTTSMSAAEISRMVGYKDPQYFSRVFKRSSGVSIRTFRAGR